MKIGILIPSTSSGRPWTTYADSYLYTLSLKTFLLTYDKEHTYTFYIGVDKNDKIYDNPKEVQQYKRFVGIMKNVSIEFCTIYGVQKGHLTAMWNQLFRRAYDEKCDYFFQCGDDISFKTKGWVNDSIATLQSFNDIGMTGPINNNPNILTQSFVSRKHMDLFGYYFPEEIVNWFCDDWINEVYRGIYRFFPLTQHFCENLGGAPRYNINNDPMFHSNFHNKKTSLRAKCSEIVSRDLSRVQLPLLLHNKAV